MSTDVSRDFLDRAYTSLREAEDCTKKFDWPLCTLRSAECVEFSLKAILGAVVGDYKRVHDVSGDLISAYDKFPEWFKVKVSRISLISRLFTFISLPAKYGDELLKVSPKKIFERPEAQAYLDVAKQVYWDCDRLFHEIKSRPSQPPS
jgi:HEPN domain-containing protein